MTRELFIDTLRRALYGKIDDYTLTGHIQYYENYISQEMAKGRSEQDVLEELGDPRLIAHTILDAAGAGNAEEAYTMINEDGQTEENGVKIHRFEGWKATLIMAAVAVVILLVLLLAFRIFLALLPLLLVIGVIGWIAKKIWY